MNRIVKHSLNSLGKVYIVGGALRDAAFRKKFRDLDFVVPPSAGFESGVKRLAKAVNAACFEMDAENRVWRMTSRGSNPFQIDIMPIQGGSIEKDLKRRDFTINALALPLNADTKLELSEETGEFSLAIRKKDIIDVCGGLDDIKKKTIRPVSAGIFREDPVRLLRAFRIAADLGLKLSPRLLASIKRNSGLIRHSAPERTREELMKLLKNDESEFWTRQLHAVGLLTKIFPELAAQEKCAVAYYGKGGVLKHTLCVMVG